MAKICLCLTAKTIERNLEILNKYRKFTDVAELRVDCLDPDERLHIRRFPEIANLPVILTIRRDSDGGHFTGGEGARIRLLARGLAFANADRRKNFAYVDIEEDLNVPSLEEAARTFGTRIIRSYHNMDGIIDDIPAKINSMKHVGDEIVKVAVKTNSTKDVIQVFRAAKGCNIQDKIIICMGHYGFYSRILSEKFGSIMTYSSALSETVTPGAAWQLDVQELNELYHFRKITNKTKVYGIVGYPLEASVSPGAFNTAFGIENTNAVYIPFPSDSINDLLELAGELEIQGLAVTVPFKEAVVPVLTRGSEAVHSIGACNVMYRSPDGWFGDNTDSTGFSTAILGFIGKKNLKRKKITVIGAGGMARAIAAEIFRIGGKALILNRTVHKARNIASLYNFRWGGLDEHGIKLIDKFSDIIIQATSVGMEGYEDFDPLELYRFSGKEAVMDLVYCPAQTPFLKRAAAAGCKTINGYGVVISQVCHQYKQIMGREISQQLLSRIVKTTGEGTWNKIRVG
ncbi:MAG: type I 3-dehydroquinate dehydratase [Treponema sp.]|nr:type I 3-dehydroquinate dehydratase [Treponema sp.]